MGGGIAGAMWDWLSHAADAALNISPAFGISPHIGLNVGIGGGFSLGFFIGLVLFVIAAARTKPGRTFEPLRAIFWRVAIGIIAGVVGFCSLFLAVEWALSNLAGKSFYIKAVSGSGWLLYGTLVMMICGAIAGALSKRAT